MKHRRIRWFVAYRIANGSVARLGEMLAGEPAAISRAVVRHHAFDLEPMGGEEGERPDRNLRLFASTSV